MSTDVASAASGGHDFAGEAHNAAHSAVVGFFGFVELDHWVQYQRVDFVRFDFRDHVAYRRPARDLLPLAGRRKEERILHA